MDGPSAHEYACMVCGETLVYSDKSSEHVCDYCGLGFTSTIYCPKGHFVCDECHSADAIDLLHRMAENDGGTSPQDLAEAAFNHSSFKFHGPEHHSLVPAALLIALKNRGIKRPNGERVTSEMVLEGIRRGSKIPGGFCGAAGTCGACVGAGVAIALFIGSTPKKGSERTLAHRATVAALERNSDGLVRCCKRSSFHGIGAAIEVLRDEYDVDLGAEPQKGSCTNWERNPDCAREDCVFYPK